MEGYDGWNNDNDYADAELLALREQERQLRAERYAREKSSHCEDEKNERRKRIRELGGKPCA